MTYKSNKHISTIKKSIAETIWPTRCAVCDKQGFLLCPDCARNLPYIDYNKTCKKCGEPFGSIQCCGCSPTDKIMTDKQKEEYSCAYKQCISAFLLDKNTCRIVTLHKDSGERRLAKVMAYFMNACIPKLWRSGISAITYIPSSKEAIIKRGFDHCQELAEEISKLNNLPLIKAFNNPVSKDQRTLGRQDRQKNLQNKFKPLSTLDKNISQIENFIIVDDVYTTGATLNSAASALKQITNKNIYCLTFTRTF